MKIRAFAGSLIAAVGIALVVGFLANMINGEKPTVQAAEVTTALEQNWQALPQQEATPQLVVDTEEVSIRIEDSWDSDEANAVEVEVKAEQKRTAAEEEAPKKPEKPQVTAIGLIHIPSLDIKSPIIEGVGKLELASGVGHLPETVRPGKKGNVSVLAGHRSSDGAVFANLPRLKDGDAVYVETKNTIQTFEVVDEWRLDGDEGLVLPSVNEETERDLLLVTCHPRWGSGERHIVHLVLTDKQSKGDVSVDEVVA